MKTRLLALFFPLSTLAFSALGCQAHQNKKQKEPAITTPPRPLPPVGPYFRELAERAKKTGHVYDRFELFREIDEVLSAPEGSGCYKEPPPAPADGYDSREHAYKDLRDLFDKGDAHAGYLLNSQTPKLFFSWEIARKRGDPYATVAVLGLRSGVGKRTPDEIREAEDAISKIESIAAKGDRQAMYELAWTSAFGKDRADHWYEKLKEQPDRLTYKAMYYRGAASFPRNGELVLEAAEHGEARAMSRLSAHFYYGSEPFTGLATKDLEKAWYWLRKFREAVGCPSPEEAPPIDMDTDKPWKKPKSKRPVRKR